MNRFRVAMVCTGNICRSPMAEVVLAHLVSERPELSGIEVSSAGTASWHVGSPMDPRARRALNRAGFHEPGTPAAYADRAYLESHDLVIVMTREQRNEVRARLGTHPPRIELIRNLLEGDRDLDLADPYYGDDGEFDACLDDITRCMARWTSEFLRERGARSREV
jgi:protein-tyrosine phosphatase